MKIRLASASPITVLVVEDEMLIRMAAVGALTDAGFHCLDAGDAAQALEHLGKKAEEVSIVCTDIHMPGAMNGVMLAHHARARWPWLALIVMSGKATPLSDDLPEGARFLPKPYDLDALVSHVRELTSA
jgi:DNA-binding NtrC family response regulator